MLKILPLSLFLTLAYTAVASDIIIPTAEEYLGGKALCESHPKQMEVEASFFTVVPVDYKNPQAEKLDVYSWFQGGFDVNKPTLVYFTGGPGIGVHWGQHTLSGEYNLLLIDQRGVACSRPRTYKEYMTPSFYSSKNIALDLEEIRKKLKIEKWSVYGVSYGTIPATMYGSMFPERTTSVILEGVAYDAETLWSQERSKVVIREAIDAQNEIVKTRLLTLKFLEADPAWFFTWAKNELMVNEGRAELLQKLSLLNDRQQFEDFVDMLKSQYGPQLPHARNELYLLNQVPYYMLACQELGIFNYQQNVSWGTNGEMIPSWDMDVFKNCRKINANPTTLYSALDYPLSVPTFYFQGENDPATDPSGAINHFEKVAKGIKQFFFLAEGGHNPSLTILREDNVGQKEIMLNAVNGVVSAPELVDQANSELSGMEWKVR